ncbi:hypothetical protein SAMN05444161_8868 [Rhizobiales bacterium GAS191]|nr:hypothetical protein SAMN05444161_8868 [Rhizobiales bacterium GAS191]
MNSGPTGKLEGGQRHPEESIGESASDAFAARRESDVCFRDDAGPLR